LDKRRGVTHLLASALLFLAPVKGKKAQGNIHFPTFTGKKKKSVIA